MNRPRVRVDFQNTDPSGRVRSTNRGSHEDLEQLDADDRDGLMVRLVSEDLASDGVIRYSSCERIRVAEFDWQAVEDR